jgi:hypothetical protein
MKKHKLFEKTVKLLVITLPLLYGITFVYLPFSQSPAMYDSKSNEIEQQLNETRSVSMRELSENTSMSHMQTWYVLTRMQQEEKVLKCRGGINLASYCPLVAGKTFNPR